RWLSFCQSCGNTNHVKDSELASLFDSPDDKEDIRSSHEYLNDIEEEYQVRALLAKSKRFFKKAKYNKVKAKLALLSLSALASKATTIKNKGLIAEAYEWDEEEVSSDDNEMVEVKGLMPLVEENEVVSKEGAKNNEWVKISMRKNKGLIAEAYEWDEEEVSSDDNEMVEVKGLMPLVEENEVVSKEGAKNNEWVKISMRKRILGVDQLTEDPYNFRQKDLVFVKSSANDIKVSILGVERPWLSEAEGFILPNHDTGRILPAESQRNTTDPSVAVTESSATEYDSTNESLFCSTPLPPLKKLDGAKPISGSKTIKSILSISKVWVDLHQDLISQDHQNASFHLTHTVDKERSIQEILNMPLKDVKLVVAQLIPQLSTMILNGSKEPIWYLDSGCSRHMTGVKSYLHKYNEQLGPKVVFGDESTCVTEGYSSINVMFDEKRGTIFNSNKEIVIIAPR
nr:retrovirus-related Pol polyprotein from transposon TNT 1-94 [Tanacetum cinerariifolium]